MILIYMIRYNGLCKINLREVRLKKEDIKSVVRNGLPAGLQSVVFSISNVLIQSTINSYGDAVIAGSAAAGNIEGFIYIAMNSLYQTAMTFAGQNVGAEKIERVKKIGFISVTVVIITGVLIGGVCLAFGDQLLSIYINDKDADAPVEEVVEGSESSGLIESAPVEDAEEAEPEGEEKKEISVAEVRAAGETRLFIICTTYFLCGVMEVLSGLMRGMGKPVIPMVVSIIGSCALRIVWIVVMCNILFPGQIELLYIAYPVTWIITSTAHLVCCIKTYKHLIRQRDARNALLAEAEEQNLIGSHS
jgi:Na+-driven multidrug efflux pump